MPMESKSTNIYLQSLIKSLKKRSREHKARICKYIAYLLSRPKRLRISVNLSKINRYTGSGDTVIVPGKVLGAGELNHPVTVAAFKFSVSAKSKIEKSGGRIISIEKLIEENPKGSNVKIII